MSEEEPTGVAAIQPIGFLVTLSNDWRISRVSANIADYVGASPGALLGQPVTTLFSPTAIHSLRNRLALLRGPDAVERLFGIPLTGAPAHYDVAVHMSGDQVMIEAEPNHDHHHDRESTGTVRAMIASLGEVPVLAAFFNDAARQMRALTGYDRVTIHRFAPDGTTQPVGEAQRGATGAAMGSAASALSGDTALPRSLVSLIADVDAALVAIIPAHDRRGRPADLSRVGLRAAPPAEIELLRAVGVRAAMTIALVVGGRAWGLIACHHHAPCCPSFERRSAAEWFAIMLAMQIEIRQLKAALASERC